ncbi:TIGR00269 family protein [Candidatus Bathyarchaeota archaeon]|nr:TIGR00269 family protein [Candidatus Bathyarchaeota archaeon]
MSLMRCSFCSSTAFYLRRHEGVRLCRRCFRRSIEGKVRATISKYKMFRPRDHIAVAVSGGKDSLTLLSILSKLKSRFPMSKITAVTIDEGIESYREEAVSLARDLAGSLQVEHEVFSFKDLFHTSLDEIVKRQGKLTPCSYCGVLRRRALEKAARILGADRVATGHNLDDEVQTALLNILHGGVERLIRSSPVLADQERRFIPRVKPLCEIYESEVALYAYVTGLEFQQTPCPYRSRALRGEIRDILNELEQKHPGLKYTAYSSKAMLSSLLSIRKAELHPCRVCGESTGNDICEACRILKENSEIECLLREA